MRFLLLLVLEATLAECKVVQDFSDAMTILMDSTILPDPGSTIQLDYNSSSPDFTAFLDLYTHYTQVSHTLASDAMCLQACMHMASPHKRHVVRALMMDNVQTVDRGCSF